VTKSPINNFSSVRPIFTINIPTDSGRKAEEYEIIKNVPNFTLWKQLGILDEKIPQKLFNQYTDPTNNSPIDSAQQTETHRNFKNFPDPISVEQPWNFRVKIPP
jgi:hypothetical protein